jgi:hypothetical protein
MEGRFQYNKKLGRMEMTDNRKTTKLSVIEKYSRKAIRGKVDKHIAVENVLLSYSLAPKDRQNNALNLGMDKDLYKWPEWCYHLMKQGLNELYDLYDSNQLEG